MAPRCAVTNHHFIGAVHASLTGDVGHHVAERESTARIVIERLNLEAEMKALIGCAAIIFALATVTSAEANGCLKGAAVGGVAGHFAGHHGVLGAAAGCVVGRHEASKRAQMQTNQFNPNDRELRKGEERY